MRIGAATIAATGHLNAMTSLARRLARRGHELTFLCAPEGEQAVRAADLSYVPLCEIEFPLGVAVVESQQINDVEPNPSLVDSAESLS